MNETIQRFLITPLSVFFKKLVNFLPNLLSSLIIILIGILSAIFLKFVLVRFLKMIHFDKFCERVGIGQMLGRGGIRDVPSNILGRIIFWLIISIFIIIALNSLQVPSVEQLMTQFLLYLPNVFVAILIVIFGYLIGNFLGRATLIASVNANLDFAGPLSHIVKLAIFLMAVTMALEQLGIGRATIIIAFGIVFGGIVLAISIAFGLGGKDLARKYLEKRFIHKEAPVEKPDDISHI